MTVQKKYVFGGLSYSEEIGMLERAGKEVFFTGKERLYLEYLLKKYPDFSTKTEIEEATEGAEPRETHRRVKGKFGEIGVQDADEYFEVKKGVGLRRIAKHVELVSNRVENWVDVPTLSSGIQSPYLPKHRLRQQLDSSYCSHAVDGIWETNDHDSQEIRRTKYVFHSHKVEYLKRDAAATAVIEQRVINNKICPSLREEASYPIKFNQEDRSYVGCACSYENTELNLIEWFKENRLHERPLEDKLDIAIELAKVIAQVHASGIVHNNLSPKNFFVTKTAEGHIRFLVANFEFASLNDEDLRSLGLDKYLREPSFQRSYAFCDLKYQAPELRDNGIASEQSDLFSLGYIMVQLITGDFDCPKDQDKWSEIIGDPVLANDLTRTLDEDTSNRHSTVDELIVDLKRLPERRFQYQETERQKEKLARQEKILPLLLTSIAALSLVLVISLFSWNRIRVEQAKTEEALNNVTIEYDRAQDVLSFVRRIFNHANPEWPGATPDIPIRDVMRRSLVFLDMDHKPENRGDIAAFAADNLYLSGFFLEEIDARVQAVRAYASLPEPKLEEIIYQELRQVITYTSLQDNANARRVLTEVETKLEQLEQVPVRLQFNHVLAQSKYFQFIGDLDLALTNASKAQALAETNDGLVNHKCQMVLHVGIMEFENGNHSAAREIFEKTRPVPGEYMPGNCRRMWSTLDVNFLILEGKTAKAKSILEKQQEDIIRIYGPNSPVLRDQKNLIDSLD